MTIPTSWSQESRDLLKKLYPNATKETLSLAFPNHSYRSLQNIAYQLGVKRERYENRNGDLSILLNKSVISFYWLGFLLADGMFSKDGVVKLDLAVKDTEHIKKYAEYIGSEVSFYPPYKSSKPGGTGICRVKVKDYVIGVKLREYLGIVEIKTYTPFSLSFIRNRDQFISFLSGFIDGDGSISKRGSISIDCHKNYYDTFTEIGKCLVDYNIISKFNVSLYKDMCRLSIHKITNCRNIKSICNELNLPLLVRKWNNIK